jgi:5-(carboxyamino)imidazole ribonucleotide mutase
MKPLVVILMGSRADMEHAQAIGKVLAELGIEYALRVGSAHKTPAHVLAMIQEGRRPSKGVRDDCRPF